jgi:outer membrane protein assembly factor BamB
MKHTTKRLMPALAAVLGIPVAVAATADWPFWGGTSGRNMVSTETGIPVTFEPGRYQGNTEEIDPATTKGVRWAVKLGSQTYGNPTVAGGRIYIGTNNESARDPRYTGDRAVLLCLDEKTGKMAWQLAIPKLGTGKVSDWEFLGLCSSPAVEGDRVYIVTNRCEIMCLDANGQANGNDGPYTDEAKYFAEKGKAPQPLLPHDADVIWKIDMREELGVFPHNITNCAPLIIGDKVVVTTSNGVDWTHTNIPAPKAPALCMVDKKTGALLGEEASGVSAATLHSNWSSPAGGTLGDKPVILFGGGDGILYALDTQTKDEDGVKILQEIWKFDCNPAQYREKNGKKLKYATFDGPSEVIATPVFLNGKVYVPIGQDPEHGEGIGNFVCLDGATGKQLWANDKIMRSLSTPAVHNGMVFVADYSGFVYCLDEATGATVWKFDTRSHIWGSCLVVDGKVLIGTEDGDLIALEASRTLKEVARTDVRAPIYASPVVANKTLYVATPTHLYAVDGSTKAASKTGKASPATIARMERRASELREEHRRVAGCVVGGVHAHAENR